MTSSQLKDIAFTALAILWLVAIIAGFWWFQARLVVTFDSDQRMLSKFPLMRDYGQALSRELPTVPQDQKNQVTIVREPGCRCNRYSSDHLASIQSAFAGSTTFHATRLSDLPVSMQALIPATPFVLIQQPGGALVYAGPVNSGVTCTSENSFLEAILQRPNDATLQIPLLARGCYCTNPVSAPL